ncbi:hypothetical protein [Xenorhabdus bovienii]|nr:hypothetical protein [Xenorhabdus bovienii]
MFSEIRALRQKVAALEAMILQLEHKPVPVTAPVDKKWWQW